MWVFEGSLICKERVYQLKKIQTGLTLLHHNLKGVIQCFENGVHVAPNV